MIKTGEYGKMIRKFIAALVLTAFTTSCVVPPVHASAAFGGETAPAGMAGGQLLNLPEPGSMVALSDAFAPMVLRGMKVDLRDPLKFDFLVDPGDSALTGDALKDGSSTLIKYFLAAVTTPEQDVWVNLSPYEKDRIIPDAFGRTEMGRDLLAQDYMLKQITASLMYPESGLGKTFWQKVYQRAFELYGTSDIPVDTFNKVWIVPERAEVYEDKGVVYIGESHMKVMLETDYLAASHSDADNAPSDMAKQIIREVMIPLIEREVNVGKNFAELRQVYQSLILAAWYKQRLKESLLSRVYADKNKVAGVDVLDKEIHQKIYAQYIEAFKKGVYDYVKDEYDVNAQETIPRKYFSGGFDAAQIDDVISHNPLEFIPKARGKGLFQVSARVRPQADEEIRGIDMTKIRSYQMGQSPMVVTRLPQDIWEGAVRSEGITRIFNGMTEMNARKWDFQGTPYSELDDNYHITAKIVELYRQGQGRSFDDPIVVLDWGCGKGTGVRGLFEEVQRLKQSGEYPDLHVRIIGYANDLHSDWENLPTDVSIIFDVADNLFTDLEHLGVKQLHLVYSHWGITHLIDEDLVAGLGHLKQLGKMMAPAGDMRLGVFWRFEKDVFAKTGLTVLNRWALSNDALRIYQFATQDNAQQQQVDAAEDQKMVTKNTRATVGQKEVISRIHYILARIALWDKKVLRFSKVKLQDRVRIFDKDPRVVSLEGWTRGVAWTFMGMFGLLSGRKFLEAYTASGIDWDIALTGALWLFPAAVIGVLYVQILRLFKNAAEGSSDEALGGMAYARKIYINRSETEDLGAFTHTAAHEMAHVLNLPNNGLLANSYEYLIVNRIVGQAAADQFSTMGRVRYDTFLYSDEAYIWARAISRNVADDLVEREILLRSCIIQSAAFRYMMEYNYGEEWTQAELETEADIFVKQEMDRKRKAVDRVLPHPAKEEPWHYIYGYAMAKLALEHYGNTEEALRFIWKLGEIRIAQPVVDWLEQHKQAVAEDPGLEIDRDLLRRMFLQNVGQLNAPPEDVVSTDLAKGGEDSAATDPTKGGIDFNTQKMDLDIRGDGSAWVQEMDPAELLRYENAPGFAPVILNISPVADLPVFLGLSSQVPQ
jgi:hypothetical protein